MKNLREGLFQQVCTHFWSGSIQGFKIMLPWFLMWQMTVRHETRAMQWQSRRIVIYYQNIDCWCNCVVYPHPGTVSVWTAPPHQSPSSGQCVRSIDCQGRGAAATPQHWWWSKYKNIRTVTARDTILSVTDHPTLLWSLVKKSLHLMETKCCDQLHVTAV